ncbi:MAG: hypothetical protein ACOZEN_16150 [Thermodesulfobacteriota bacterium]
MRTLTMTLAAIAGCGLLFLTGCAVNTARDLVARGSAVNKSWGRTILVCRINPSDASESGREKVARIIKRVEEALDGQPGVTRLPEEALTSRLSGRSPVSLSDGELAAAALDAGADTVLVVQVLGYAGELTISLVPPFWSTGTQFAYHARAIDARTGSLYLDAHRGRKKGGAFTAHGRDELDRDFTADLSALFKAAKPDAPAAVGEGS